MKRYRYEIDNVRSHLRSLWGVIVLQLLVIVALWIALMRLPATLTVHIPPDLSRGASLAVEEIPRANVYTFAFYILQQLNRWPENGAQDYGAAIFRSSAYLTPEFREALISDMHDKSRVGELTHRVRGLQAIPGQGFSNGRVTIISADEWQVWLDLELSESVKGMTVKHTRIRYPLRVVRYAVDAEANPWGLALAGYAAAGPTRIDDAAAGTSAKESQ
jgi:integrating conjugative element protein (TIGR03746 family)